MDEQKILIVDDEANLVRLVSAYLESEGYRAIGASDGESALEAWRTESPDLIVLDILMPGMDGLEFCRRVRRESDIPIIILSAKAQEPDKLAGLELGADDYVTKPFSSRELVARVRAVLRRRAMGAQARELPVVEGPLFIDRESHRVKVADSEVKLSPTEFDILYLLASNPGRVYSRGRLIEEVHGEYFEGYERTVDSHVKNIRRKLKDKAEDWSFIETAYGVGYRFQPERD